MLMAMSILASMWLAGLMVSCSLLLLHLAGSDDLLLLVACSCSLFSSNNGCKLQIQALARWSTPTLALEDP